MIRRPFRHCVVQQGLSLPYVFNTWTYSMAMPLRVEGMNSFTSIFATLKRCGTVENVSEADSRKHLQSKHIAANYKR